MEKLTERKIKAIEPTEKEYYIREGNGFMLRVQKPCSKSFYFIYDFQGKRYRLNLGQHPAISLDDARKKHMQAMLQLKDGINPKAVLVVESEAQAGTEVLTVKGLSELWEKWSGVNLSKKWENTLLLAVKKDVLPFWGNRTASEIKRRDAIELLEKKAKTAPGQARNLHKALRGMWSYAVDRELVEFNPFSEIRPAKSIPTMKQISRERILLDDEIKYLWTAIDQGGGSDSLKRCLKLILITGQRPGEVAGMDSREIDGNWWTIPAERRKGNKGGLHRVYLSPLALELISQSTEKCIVCPGSDPNTSITENAVAYHVRKMVPTTGKTPYYGLDRWTPHDLRRTAATGMAKLGSTPAEVEMILGHSLGGVAAVYNRHQYDQPKQDWLQKWSDYLQKLLH